MPRPPSAAMMFQRARLINRLGVFVVWTQCGAPPDSRRGLRHIYTVWRATGHKADDAGESARYLGDLCLVPKDRRAGGWAERLTHEPPGEQLPVAHPCGHLMIYLLQKKRGKRAPAARSTKVGQVRCSFSVKCCTAVLRAGSCAGSARSCTAGSNSCPLSHLLLAC